MTYQITTYVLYKRPLIYSYCYLGDINFDYDHKQTSSAGAVGPMQIITRWAQPYVKKRVTAKELRNNIDLNVMISMKMLRKWYSIHHDWTLACGAYNSGQPIRNAYAVYATTNKDYKEKWERIYE